MNASPTIHWQWCVLGELGASQLYALFAARSAVFVVEQSSIYLDMDGLDLDAEHLIGWSNDEVAATLRVLAPGTRFAEPSIGRVLTTRAFRGGGIGRELIARGLERTDQRYPHHAIRISAQSHLERLYAGFGFRVASEPYLEDGIPHIEMLRPPAK